MHSIGGDEGLEHEDTEGEHEEAVLRPAAEPTGDSTASWERQKEDELTGVDSTEAVLAAQPATVRQDGRENADTRTPSSCSDDVHQASSDCGEDASPEVQGHQRQNSPISKSTPSKSSSAKSREEAMGSVTKVPSDNGTPLPDVPGSPPAAMIPHISMPGLHGPRPAPALGGKPFNGQQPKGPLRDLISWLDDADVGDVLDQASLTELLPIPGNGNFPHRDLLQGALPSMVVAERLLVQRPGAVARGEYFPQDDGSVDEDDFEEVPSDKECLPRAPPLAPSAAPLMRPLSPEHLSRELQPHQRLAGYCANPGGLPLDGHNEEEEWFARQRLTGAICRLVRYHEVASTPKDDILGLRCTRRGRIMVTAVREHGIAAKAGVVAGDELVSIDGRKEFIGHPAHVVHASLMAPTTLVFLGFVGKLQAEVRVKRPPEPKCGLAPGAEVVINTLDAQLQPLKLCDAVVFKQGESASLLMTAERRGIQAHLSTPVPSPVSDSTLASTEPSSKVLMYELQREDARNLIVNALGTTAAL